MEFHTASVFGMFSPEELLAFALAVPILLGVWIGLKAW